MTEEQPLKLDVGDGDDADGYIDNEEIHVDATEVLFGPALDGVLTGKTYAADDTIDILFSATGANVSVLDAGEVEIFFNIICWIIKIWLGGASPPPF